MKGWIRLWSAGPLNWNFGVIFSPPSTECIKQPSPILGLQPRDKAAMLRVNTIEFFLKNLHENRVKLPEERNAFVLDLQYGRRDVTCKPAMASLLHGISPSTVTGKKPLPAFWQTFYWVRFFRYFSWRKTCKLTSIQCGRCFIPDVLVQFTNLPLPLSYSCPFALADRHKTRKHYKLAVKTL